MKKPLWSGVKLAINTVSIPSFVSKGDISDLRPALFQMVTNCPIFFGVVFACLKRHVLPLKSNFIEQYSSFAGSNLILLTPPKANGSNIVSVSSENDAGVSFF